MSKRKYRRNYKRGFQRGYVDGYATGLKAAWPNMPKPSTQLENMIREMKKSLMQMRAVADSHKRSWVLPPVRAGKSFQNAVQRLKGGLGNDSTI